jgi:hypothetical protein
MAEQIEVFSPDLGEWAKRELLYPQLEDLLVDGALRIPGRFANKEEGFEAIWRLIKTQMSLIRDGRSQTIEALGTGSGRSGAQVQELLEAVSDWPGLIHGLRFRESDRGSLSIDGSTFVLKTAQATAYGPAVFAAASPAYPKEVQEVLAAHDLPQGSCRAQDAAVDSAVHLVEVHPKVSLCLATATLPEGSQWDYTDSGPYPEEISGQAKRALEDTAGAEYRVKTSMILKEQILDPFVANRDRLRGRREKGDPIESGWIGHGPKGAVQRFLGGELDTLRYLEDAGFAPFLDLPRTLLPGPADGSPSTCTFLIGGEVIPAVLLTWAAQTAFGSKAPRPRLKDSFRLVNRVSLELAGCDPDLVEYAYALARVGKDGSRKRRRILLLVRNDGGSLSAWGIPRAEPKDDLDPILREAVIQGEAHIERMRPSGGYQQTLERLQPAGLQTMGVKVPHHRTRREHLILAADILLQRALLHL